MIYYICKDGTQSLQIKEGEKMEEMNGNEVLVEETEQKMLYKFLDMIHEAKENNESIQDLEAHVRNLIKK